MAAHERIGDGKDRRLVGRNGHLPERTIQTGIGDIAIKALLVRDRSGSGIRFASAILPSYLRRARSSEELTEYNGGFPQPIRTYPKNRIGRDFADDGL